MCKGEIVHGLSRSEQDNTSRSEILTSLAIMGLRKSIISRGTFADLCDIDRCDIDDFINEEGKLYTDGESFEVMDT